MAHEDEKKHSEADDHFEPFDLEPHDEGAEPELRPEQPQPKKKPEPLDLEQHEVDEEAAATHAGDKPRRTSKDHDERCPNCGAPMADRHALLCLRCGYDLKRLEVAKTRIGKPVEVDEEQEKAASTPVSRPGRGDVWLPLAMAGISVLLLIIGHLAGLTALYPDIVATTPQGAEVTISFGARVTAVLQTLVLIVLWCVCGLAGLFLLAQALQRPVGEMKLAAARMLGIIATIRLATFIELSPRWVQWLTESLIQGAAFIALSILLYTLKPRDGAMMGGFALAALVALWLCARAMVWALEGG